jgi:photosystem II stability/assembly factor-like uncharacterized protein
MRSEFRSRFSATPIGILLISGLIAVTSAASATRPPAVAARVSSVAGGGQLPGAGTLVLGFIHMMSATVGWAFGGQAGQQAVLRTADGGNQWADVTPHVAMGHSFTVFHFIGPDHAWLGLPGIAAGQRTLTVYRTVDAGKSWAQGEAIILPDEFPNAAPLDPGLQFVDFEHGWLTLVLQTSDPGSSGVAIYATVDAGAQWKLISLTLDHPGSSSANGLPIGCQKTGVVFNNPSRGWATAHCPDGSLFFFSSGDGGASWHPKSLPPPAGYPANLFGNCDCGSVPPIFETASDGTLMFHAPDLLYLTHDGGDTWLAVPLPARYVAESQLIDAQHGWLNAEAVDPVSHTIRPDRLYVTADGGLSWQPVDPNHPLAGDLQFINDRSGWLIDRHSATPQLYKTTDGGRTWEPVHPRLTTRPSQSA